MRCASAVVHLYCRLRLHEVAQVESGLTMTETNCLNLTVHYMISHYQWSVKLSALQTTQTLYIKTRLYTTLQVRIELKMQVSARIPSFRHAPQCASHINAFAACTTLDDACVAKLATATSCTSSLSEKLDRTQVSICMDTTINGHLAFVTVKHHVGQHMHLALWLMHMTTHAWLVCLLHVCSVKVKSFVYKGLALLYVGHIESSLRQACAQLLPRLCRLFKFDTGSGEWRRGFHLVKQSTV